MTSWKLEDQYTMEKNPNYWDKESLILDKINTKILKDNNVAINLYTEGEIDRAPLAPEQIDKFKDSDELINEREANVSFMLLNSGK